MNVKSPKPGKITESSLDFVAGKSISHVNMAGYTSEDRCVMENSDPLGIFGRLPPEIRCEIWSLIPAHQSTREFEEVSMHTSLAILNTNKFIRYESWAILFENMEITFVVNPMYIRDKWLEVMINDCTSISFVNLKDAYSKGLHTLLSQRLRGIKVEIYAAQSFQEELRRTELKVLEEDSDSRGQFLCLFKKCKDVAELVEHIQPGIVELRFQFLDTDIGTWFKPASEEGQCEEVLFGDTSFHEDWKCYGMMLAAFFMVRGAKQVKIELPGDSRSLLEREDHDALQCYEDLMGPNRTAHRTTQAGELKSDVVLKRDRDSLFINMENTLDGEGGATAAMLRLDRYANWYAPGVSEIHEKTSHYEVEIERIIFSQALSNQRRLESAMYMRDRQLYLRFYNPDKRFVGDTVPPDTDWIRECLELEWALWESLGDDQMNMKTLYDRGIIKDFWNTDMWFRFFPDGIGSIRQLACISDMPLPIQWSSRFFEKVGAWVKARKTRPAKADSQHA